MKTTVRVIIILIGLVYFSLYNTSAMVGSLLLRDRLEQKIDSLVSIQLTDEAPGVVIAVLVGDDVLYKKCYGLMNVDNQQMNHEKTLFDIASVAKMFTAYAILMLEEEGRLTLDDDIRTHLPNLPEYPHIVSIRNLLQHTSGIASTDVLRLLAGLPLDELWTQQDEVALINRYPYLNFEPNTSHLYSNAGYALLANIVEQISGMRFPEYMARSVFTPVGMTSTMIMSEEIIDPARIATGYKQSSNGYEQFSTLDDLSYGSGNMFTSLHDIILWGQNVLGNSVGVPDYLRRISHPYNTLNNGDTLNYTYGFYTRSYKGIELVEHSGGVPGFRNQFMVFPEENTMIVVMCNNESISSRTLATGIADILFVEQLMDDAPKHRIALEFSADDVKAFEGSYLMSDGMELTFAMEQDTFWLFLPGDNRFELFAETQNHFFLKAFDAQCTFVVSDDGSVNELIWHQRGQDHNAGRIYDRISLDKSELPIFAGTYYHPNLHVYYMITFDNGSLILHPPDTFEKYLGIKTVELSHVNGDKFHSGWLGTVEFSRGEDNQVNGFVLLNVGRVQNVTFNRKL